MPEYGSYQQLFDRLEVDIAAETPRDDDLTRTAEALREMRHLAHLAPIDWAAHPTTAMLHLLLTGMRGAEGDPQPGRTVQLAVRHNWIDATVRRLGRDAATLTRFMQDPIPQPEPLPDASIPYTPGGIKPGWVRVGQDSTGSDCYIPLTTALIAADWECGGSNLLRVMAADASLADENVVWAAAGDDGTFTDGFWRTGSGDPIVLDRIADGEADVVAMLTDALAIAKARAAIIRGVDQLPASVFDPRLIIFVDDLERSRGRNDEIVDLLCEVVRLGRAQNVHVVMACNDPAVLPAQLRKRSMLVVGRIEDTSARAYLLGRTSDFPCRRFEFTAYVPTLSAIVKIRFRSLLMVDHTVGMLGEATAIPPRGLPAYQGYDPAAARRAARPGE